MVYDRNHGPFLVLSFKSRVQPCMTSVVDFYVNENSTFAGSVLIIHRILFEYSFQMLCLSRVVKGQMS
jgi:hypothetical protein